MRRNVTVWVALLGLVAAACGSDEAIEVRSSEPTAITISEDDATGGVDPDAASPESSGGQSLTDTVRDFGVIQNGPTLEGDLLVFRAGDVELIYQRSTD